MGGGALGFEVLGALALKTESMPIEPRAALCAAGVGVRAEQTLHRRPLER